MTVTGLPCLAQQLGGKVFDSAGRHPLPFVTVHVIRGDRAPVKTVLSDSVGSFMVAVDSGAYFLVYTCAGYHPFQSREITVSPGPRTELPAVFLRRDTAQLTPVTVLGRRPVVEPLADGFVYNAANDVAIAAGSAADLLRKIPMVTVMPDGSPSIRGSTNIRVFIDNKPSSVYAASVADALQQVPSEEIARVEIITHPSARYDAEGADAVINIITRKKRYDGFNGTARSNIGNWQQDATATVKMRTGYWITNFDGGLYFQRNESGYTLRRSANAHETANRLYQVREATLNRNTQIVAAGITRIIDSLHTLNAGYRFRKSSAREQALQRTQVFSNDTLATAFSREIPSEFQNGTHSFTAGYSGQSRNKQKEYNVLAAWVKDRGTDRYDLQQLREAVVDYREQMNSTTTGSEWSAQADLVQHFTKTSRLETGFKGNWRNARSESNIDIYNWDQGKFLRDPLRSNTFHYDRGIYAVYGSYSHSIKSWQFRAGLRFELTHLYTQFKDTALQIPNVNNLLPNLLLKKNLNEKTSITYSYNPRINRPSLYILNPNINYIDSLSIIYGNPALLPEIYNNHVLDFNYNNRSLFAGIALRYTVRSRGVEEVRLLRADKVLATTYRNIGHAETWGLSGNLRFNNGKLNLGTTVVAYHLSLESPALNLSNSGLIATVDVNASYRFKKGFSIESFVYYETGSIALQQERGHYWFYNLLLGKKLMNDKLNITFRMDGFFDPWFYRPVKVHSPTLFQETQTRSINRYLRIALSYKFGKDIRTPVSRTIENGD